MAKKEDKDKKYLLQDDIESDPNDPMDIRKATDLAKKEKKNVYTYVDGKKVKVTPMGETEEVGVITAEQFLSMVRNQDKLNLSESDIIRIIKQQENPRMTKKDLVEEIKNQILFEADMNDDVRRKFESGENDFSEYLDPDTVRRISQEVFGDVQQNLRDKTGRQHVGMGDVQMLLGSSLVDAIQKEQRIGINRLQNLAVQMIRKHFTIPEDAVDFQAEITGLPQMGGRPIQKGNVQYEKGNKRPPQGKSGEELKPEVTRRRLTNAMMHGAARKSQNLHHLADELREGDPSLNRDYSNIMAANDYMYWGMSDDDIREQGRHGVHAGNVKLDLSGEKPKIIAQGIVFPILLHELAKGVMELMSLWSLPENKDVRDYVTDKTDHLDAETNDIRLGQYIWSKFVEQIPVDNQEVISLTFNKLQKLSTREFNSVISGLVNDQEQARSVVRELANESIEELRSEEYEEAIGQYSDDDYEEDGGLATQEPPAEDEPMDGSGEEDYSTWSRRELESAIDAALDANDFDLVSKLSQYLK